MNLSILKKIGADIAEGALLAGKVIATAEGYGPLLNALLPNGVGRKVESVEVTIGHSLAKVDDIVKMVQGVGALSNMTGQDKLTAASGLAVTAFSDAMSLAGHEVQDVDLLAKAKDEFTQAMKMLVQSRADFLNSLKAKS